LYGTNSDEGTDNEPADSKINKTQQLFDYIKGSTVFDCPDSVISKILELYPDDPTQGIPLNTSIQRFEEQGTQYKRAAAIVGDVFHHAPRLNNARWYANSAPTYIYRFNTKPWQNSNTVTKGGNALAHKGVGHFSEVAFVLATTTFYGPWPEYRMFSHTVENDKASGSHGNLTRETASQRQRFLGLNKGPGIFLRMRQEGGTRR
jgi:carboxylesterase type B